MLNALASRAANPARLKIPAETKPEGEQQAPKTEAKTDTQTKSKRRDRGKTRRRIPRPKVL